MLDSTSQAFTSIEKRGCLLLLALSLALSAFLRVPYFQYNFIFVDEAVWANGANELYRGGQLYRDIDLDKNPPIFWFCAFLFTLFGVSMNAIHAGVLLLVFIISILLFMFGSRFFTPGVGAAAALIYAVASTTYYIPRIIGMNTETLMILFSILAAFAYLAGVMNGRLLSLFIAGLFASFAFLTKPVALTEMACLILFGIAHGGGSVLSRLRSMTILVSGFALGLGAFLAYLFRAGILSAWWEQAVLYGFRYVGRTSPGSFITKSLRVSVGFGLIFAWLLILVWLSRRKRSENNRAYIFVLYWMLSAFVGAAIGRRYYANYFIQVMPPLSILGGIGLVHLWSMRHQADIRFIKRVCCAAFLISFLWFHSRTMANWISLAFPQMHRLHLWGMEIEDQRNREIASRLASAMSPHDRFFVWGSKPQLYFLTGRRAATKCMDFDVGDDYPPKASELSTQAQLAESLRRSRPRFIVDVQQSAHLNYFPSLHSLVEKHYILDSQIAGARLYKLRGSDPQNGVGSGVPETSRLYETRPIP